MTTGSDIIALYRSGGAIGLRMSFSKQPNWELGNTGSSESNRVEGVCVEEVRQGGREGGKTGKEKGGARYVRLLALLWWMVDGGQRHQIITG